MSDGNGDLKLPYGAEIRGMLLAIVAVGLVEAAGVHLVLRNWRWIWWLTGLSVAAVVITLWQYRALKAFPHRVHDGELILRDGRRVVARVPLPEVRSVRWSPLPYEGPEKEDAVPSLKVGRMPSNTIIEVDSSAGQDSPTRIHCQVDDRARADALASAAAMARAARNDSWDDREG